MRRWHVIRERPSFSIRARSSSCMYPPSLNWNEDSEPAGFWEKKPGMDAFSIYLSMPSRVILAQRPELPADDGWRVVNTRTASYIVEYHYIYSGCVRVSMTASCLVWRRKTREMERDRGKAVQPFFFFFFWFQG